MSIQTRREVLAKLRARYARAGHDYKAQILDQVVKLFGLHRKSAIRRLARPPINSLVLASYSANGGFLALSLFVPQPSGDESHADAWQAWGSVVLRLRLTCPTSRWKITWNNVGAA